MSVYRPIRVKSVSAYGAMAFSPDNQLMAMMGFVAVAEHGDGIWDCQYDHQNNTWVWQRIPLPDAADQMPDVD